LRESTDLQHGFPRNDVGNVATCCRFRDENHVLSNGGWDVMCPRTRALRKLPNCGLSSAHGGLKLACKCNARDTPVRKLIAFIHHNIPVNVLRSMAPVLSVDAADLEVASLMGEPVVDRVGDPGNDPAPVRPNPSRNDPESSVEIGAGREGDSGDAMATTTQRTKTLFPLG
jgi:hypothetical protein